MQFKYIVGITLVLWAGHIVLSSCSKNTVQQNKKISYYTCPMHHQIHQDHPGECPICHMTLVPVYEEGSKAPSVEPGVSISTDKQQLIGLKTEEVTKQKIVKEIRTSGRVAFDPDLAIAIREYQETIQNVPSLKKAAENRLRLLGLSEEEIQSFGKKGNGDNLYLPQVSQPIWVYAALYESEMDLVKPGQKVFITLPSGEEKNFTGVVRGIDRVVDPTTRSVTARIEVPGAGGRLRPETYVNVALQTDLGEVLAVRKSAIVATGTRRVVFVIHDGTRFESREIETTTEAGDWVVVKKGLDPGEIVAISAAFLIDSESSLKAAVSSLQTPSCPDGEVWDVGMSMCMPKIQ